MTGFGERLRVAMETNGPLCVGIDPHGPLLAAWGLPDTPAGLREFCLRALTAAAGVVAAVKPQSAFFERHGSAGIAVLEEVLAAARELGVLSILDVKRGDIGSTMAGYAQAYLAPGAPLAADAITLAPYLGAGALEPAVQLAASADRGVFVLALTSNPEGRAVQHASLTGGGAVARGVSEWARHANSTFLARAPHAWERSGPVGLVVGATVGRAPLDLGVDLAGFGGVILAPGLGEQGARPSDLPATFGKALPQVLVSSSRAILSAGPKAMRTVARELADQLRLLTNS